MQACAHVRACTQCTGGPPLTATFFCVTNTTLSLPRTPMLVTPAERTALKAYSVVVGAGEGLGG